MSLQSFISLDEKTLHDISQLNDRCRENDKYQAKLYWQILQTRSPAIPMSFCYYQEKKLLGFLAFFLFERNTAEICAFVHPQRRQQQIFKQLYLVARVQLTKLGTTRGIFLCPQKANEANAVITKLAGSYLESEYHLKLNRLLIPNSFGLKLVTLIPATLENLESLVQLDNQCLNSDYLETLQQFSQNLVQPNRRTWLAYHQDKLVGKMHVRFDDDMIYIHNFCVLPAFQGQQLGTTILIKTIQTLQKETLLNISLDVTSKANHALNLYKKVGFEVIDAYDNWVVRI